MDLIDTSGWIFLTLGMVGAVAGFVDAIAGGGGLLTVPSLMLAGLPPHLALGTNKGQSVVGTGIALSRFWKHRRIDTERAKKVVIPAIIGAFVGVEIVTQISKEALSILVIILLMSVAIFMVLYDPHRRPGKRPHRGIISSSVIAASIAFYDGFFGPGTGTFLILAAVLWWKDSLDLASANAKVINFLSNITAAICFAAKGMIVWKFALPMALGQIVGGYLGAHVTIKGGANVVRYFVLMISLLIVLRLAWNVLL